MNVFKRIAIGLLACAMALSMAACSGGGGGGSSSGSSANKGNSSSTQDQTQITVSVSVSSSSGGTVSGGGTYNKGDSVTVKATPSSGYSFMSWQNNGATVSTSASYTFTASENVTLTAEFGENDLSGYKISQLSEQTVNGYTAQYEIYDSDMEYCGTGYLTTNGKMQYTQTDYIGTTTTLKDSDYEYTLYESDKIYTKEKLYSSEKSDNYALIKTSAIESVTAGKTTVEGVEYYSEKVAVSSGGYTVCCTYCFDSSGNLKYAILDTGYSLLDETIKYTSITYTADTSKLTLDGYKEMTDPIRVDVAANSSAFGTVSGGGIYENGSEVTVTATPASGYSFVGWSRKKWLYGSTVVSTDLSYTFEASAEYADGFGFDYGYADEVLTAEFAKTPEGSVTINEDAFPDATFRSYISTNFDTDGDGALSSSEILAVKKIDVSGSYSNRGSITSLEGIEYFTNLRELRCVYNQLTSLDLSENELLTSVNCNANQLTNLNVSKNTLMTSLDCSSNRLTSLDVSQNTALEGLGCFSNYLVDLDLSRNAALKYLSCESNLLTSLALSQNPELWLLECNDNQLTSLDVSKNINLYELNCQDNQLTSLDVSKNIALEYLYCASNQLTSLDVSQNEKLKYLDCQSNQLTSLNVSGAVALTELICSDDLLTSLDVSKNTALKRLECENNELTSLDVSQNTKLYSLYCEGNQLTSLDVSDATNSPTVSADRSTTVIREKTVTVTASPSDCGLVSGGGSYQKGTSATVSATANAGYEFKEWQVNGVTVSTDASYTFTVSGNYSLTAVFAPENLKEFAYSSVSYNGNDYSDYYVLKAFTPSACYNQNNYPTFVNSSGQNVGCTATADAAAYTAQTGYIVNPTDSWSSSAGICTWKWCSVEQTTTTVSQQLSQIYTNLMNGKATVVRLKNSYGEHSVAAVGIRKGADKNNLTQSDILIIDPGSGKVMNASQIVIGKEAAAMYSRSGGKDYCLRVTP